MFIANKQKLNSTQMMSTLYMPQINDFIRLEK